MLAGAPAAGDGHGRLQTASLVQELEETDGYELLEQRRRGKFEKVLHGGAMLGPDGLAETISRPKKST